MGGGRTWPYGSPVGPSCSARLPYVTMTCGGSAQSAQSGRWWEAARGACLGVGKPGHAARHACFCARSNRRSPKLAGAARGAVLHCRPPTFETSRNSRMPLGLEESKVRRCAQARKRKTGGGDAGAAGGRGVGAVGGERGRPRAVPQGELRQRQTSKHVTPKPMCGRTREQPRRAPPTCVLFSTNSAMNLSSAVVTSGVSA